MQIRPIASLQIHYPLPLSSCWRYTQLGLSILLLAILPGITPLDICLTGPGTVMWNPCPIYQKSCPWFSQSFGYHASTHSLELRGDVWASTSSKTSQAGGFPRPSLRLGVRFCRTSYVMSSTYLVSDGSSTA